MALSTHQQKHIETWQASGLTQVAYCRSYDHFWCMTGEESGVIC